MGERKRLQPELRRRQILDAAVRLFYEVGYEGASLRDLSARVGINKATIYHYFESKEDILFDLVRRVGQELLEGVRQASREQGTPLEVLEAMIRFQIGYVENHVEEIKVLVEEKKSLRADLQQTSRANESEILRLYKEALSRCRAKGLVRPVHATTAAFGILGQINWLYHWYKPEGPLSIRELADAVVSLLFHGLLPCPGEPEIAP
ncbi:MAG: TetR/AcrR family transcriptional regulator [Deferrisomatales bacterium]|nr:TetR/AcrR family transcriptional regulator [Deferrisomatales bacterium]